MAIEALYLFDVNEELIDIIPGEELLEHGQTQELKKLITANASALYSEDLEQAVFVGHRDIDNSNVFHQYRVTTFKNTDGIVEIEGVHAFFDDMQAYGYIKDKRPADATAATALGGILEGSRWQIGVNQCTTSATSNYYYVSRLEAFWDFVEKWNVEFKLRMVYSDGVIIARYVDIYDQLSADYGKWYEYGDQLLTVEKEEDRQGVYTALIGRGKGEETEAGGFGRRILFSDVEWAISGGDPVDKPLLQDYVELPSATAQYGYSDGTPRIGIVEFEDITDKALLLDATYQTLLNNCRPQVQFKAGVDEQGVSELGEIVTIIRDDLNIRYKTRVYKLRRNFLDVMDKEFTFGDKLTTTQGERSVQINKDIKKQQQQTISWLEVVNAAMMSMFWNEDGYNYTFSAVNDYNLPGGFYSFNAPIDQNPTKCIYMGAGMLAIANSKLPDGSWNFRTWGTGDGFTADLINAGTIVGTNMTHDLESGVSTYTNPLTGDKLIFNQGEIIFQNGDNLRHFKYNEEGWILEPDAGNVGTAGNTGLILKGRDGAHKYIDGVNTTFNDREHHQRITMINDVIRLHSYSGVEVRDNIYYDGQDAFTYLRAEAFLMGGSASWGMYEDASLWTQINGQNGVGLQVNGTTILGAYAGGLEANADLYMNGHTIWNESDVELKLNVLPSDIDAIAETKRQNVVEFEWDLSNPHNVDKPEGKQLGLIAQDAGVLQIPADKTGKGYMGVDIMKQINLNTLANQKLIDELETTKQELADIKALLTSKGVI